MANGDDFVAQYRAIVESRVREQIERHQRVNPSGDPRSVVDIQIKQERELLERLIEKDETTPSQVEACTALIAWLPQLARQLKGG